jgi:hypothetical protein
MEVPGLPGKQKPRTWNPLYVRGLVAYKVIVPGIFKNARKFFIPNVHWIRTIFKGPAYTVPPFRSKQTGVGSAWKKR